jgi:FkbM family methyltransferase
MVTSTLGRYRNLITFVRNWPLYFAEKRHARFVPLEFVTRGNSLRFEVASKGLYLVFKEIFLSDFYSVRELVCALPSEPVVIDVGANAGYFGMMLFSRVPGARMFAFEPIEENHRLCAANIARNGALDGRITLRQAAVTGTPVESVELFAEEAGTSVTASVVAGFDPHNARRVRARAVALADILREHALARVDLLKLDCEGSEYPIVYESPRELWPIVRAIVLEVHDLDDDRRNVRALTRYLEELGYRCSREAAKNACWALFARRAG